MAKSSSYFGLRRGSTKSHTFSVVNGKQITKDRVEGGKNPRTYNQMAQRCLIATIGQAYSALKAIADHSFEGVTAGSQSMQKFISENLKKIKLAKEYDNGTFGFNKYQENGLVPGCYVMSRGSLDDCAPDMSLVSINVASKQIVIDAALGASADEIAADLGMKNFGDMATLCVIFPKANGFYGFGAIRLTYKAGSGADAFDVAWVGDVKTATVAFASSKLTATITMVPDMKSGATVAEVGVCAIASRYMDGKWLRSNAQFDIEDCEPDFDEAIATYPIGQERFLNGEGQQSSSAPATHALTLGFTTDSVADEEDATLTGAGNYAAGDNVQVKAEYDGPSGTNFDGWYDAASGGTKVSSNATYNFVMHTSDLALYAKYVTA